MLHSDLGKVFLYNNNKKTLNAFNDIFSSHSLKMFGSDNLYQIIRYAKEIQPDMTIFNLHDDDPITSPILHFNQAVTSFSPIIVIKPENRPFETHPNIAHYLHFPKDMNKFLNIMKSYSIGNQNHQILLIDNFTETPTYLQQQLLQSEYTFFEVHNFKAAQFYLMKNQPQIICIDKQMFSPSAELYSLHKYIFYVDMNQDITEIKKFIH